LVYITPESTKAFFMFKKLGCHFGLSLVALIQEEILSCLQHDISIQTLSSQNEQPSPHCHRSDVVTAMQIYCLADNT
jgi:hypothetical protein